MHLVATWSPKLISGHRVEHRRRVIGRSRGAKHGSDCMQAEGLFRFDEAEFCEGVERSDGSMA